MNPITVTINEDSAYKTVHVEQSPGQGTAISLDLTPKEAVNLMTALIAKSNELSAILAYYYECKECGAYHEHGTEPHRQDKESEDTNDAK